MNLSEIRDWSEFEGFDEKIKNVEK